MPFSLLSKSDLPFHLVKRVLSNFSTLYYFIFLHIFLDEVVWFVIVVSVQSITLIFVDIPSFNLKNLDDVYMCVEEYICIYECRCYWSTEIV